MSEASTEPEADPNVFQIDPQEFGPAALGDESERDSVRRASARRASAETSEPQAHRH